MEKSIFAAMHFPTVELTVFPPISVVALAFSAGGIRLEGQENFQKGSFRNRFEIAAAHGRMPLSVPLKGGKNQQCPVQKIEIADGTDWARCHWRSIESAYRGSPFWEHYADHFRPFFFEKQEVRLWDWSLAVFEKTMQLVDYQGVIETTTAFEPHLEADFRNVFSPKKNERPDAFQSVRYPQIFEERHGFLADLSCLDLLFCQGRRSHEVLKNAWKKSD